MSGCRRSKRRLVSYWRHLRHPLLVSWEIHEMGRHAQTFEDMVRVQSAHDGRCGRIRACLCRLLTNAQPVGDLVTVDHERRPGDENRDVIAHVQAFITY